MFMKIKKRAELKRRVVVPNVGLRDNEPQYQSRTRRYLTSIPSPRGNEQTSSTVSYEDQNQLKAPAKEGNKNRGGIYKRQAEFRPTIRSSSSTRSAACSEDFFREEKATPGEERVNQQKLDPGQPPKPAATNSSAIDTALDSPVTKKTQSTRRAPTNAKKPKKALPKLKVLKSHEEFVDKHVLCVESVEDARSLVQNLSKLSHVKHAWDTEAIDIDVSKDSPNVAGKEICLLGSICPGNSLGNGKCTAWVDTLRKPEILGEFRDYFADTNLSKIFHNYGFDRHLLYLHDLNVLGFGGDTMHMARLLDTSRQQKGYSLAALTSDMESVMDGLEDETEILPKSSMKEMFGEKYIKKDNTEGKTITLPPLETIQENPKLRKKWIGYSTVDAYDTWLLHYSLSKKLEKEECDCKTPELAKYENMLDFYESVWLLFGELLTDLERAGMQVDQDHLDKVEIRAVEDKIKYENFFRRWVEKAAPDCDVSKINIGSDVQIRQILFGGIWNKNVPPAIKEKGESSEEAKGHFLPSERSFSIDNDDNFIEPDAVKPKKKRLIKLRRIKHSFEPKVFTASGWPSVGIPVLRVLAGKSGACDDYENGTLDDGKCGEALKAFGGGIKGKEACAAFDALCQVSAIDTLLKSFIKPLQGTKSRILSPDNRVHCSLNINTETGRLSARRPNLQNQPALEKDRYKIRQAFQAGDGKKLVVADYGQLELRILAHVTNCASMIEAFKGGGDFHSRTALGMYDYIKQDVDSKGCILEWDYADGDPPVPLIKEKYAAERRKAKTLNFSIAYGKTAHGLSKDWGVSLSEAKNTLERWYNDRPEVKEWQDEYQALAEKKGWVLTLLGRKRHLPHAKSKSRRDKGHALRAAINSPIQGGAADVVNSAMIKLFLNKELQQMGWKMVLQVHDEIILEGPEETSLDAMEIVKNTMSFPFGDENPLRVDLVVDANSAKSWYEAK